MTTQGEQPTHLMVSGRVDAAEIHRGMIVVDEVEETIAFVAGVLVGEGDARATHLLLGRLPPTNDYRLVPVDRITTLYPDRIGLNLEIEGWESLPQHEPE